jgi:NADPH:quinone reductase-like Zn-dependent oxidoreductase
LLLPNKEKRCLNDLQACFLSVPSIMQCLVLQNDRSVKVERRDVPICGPNQLLIRNLAFGQNPSDWKHALYLSEPGVIMGCDSVGLVEEIGSAIPAGFTHEGERRGLFMHGTLALAHHFGLFSQGGTSQTNGAFAGFTAIDYDLTFRVPSNLSNEDAATLPACFFTACQILYLRMGLPEPAMSTPSRIPTVLVWSGATSVGQFVIQLARLSGCRVLATASPERWTYLKELGASECFDYKVSPALDYL